MLFLREEGFKTFFDVFFEEAILRGKFLKIFDKYSS